MDDSMSVIQQSSNLYRLRAPNPGVMTGTGTNTYLVKSDNTFIVIDPGPDDESHITAILAFVGGPRHISKILVTHMHPDHSPAAAPLARLTGAKIYGWSTVDDEYQDTSCVPDIIVAHDDIIEDGHIRIRCLYTPGHVDNHVCFYIENDGVLITGDHIMQGTTVVIIPPHGSMKKYIESLELLKAYPLKQLAPGHGEMIDNPYEEIDRIIHHRLARENKVFMAMKDYVSAPIDELLEVVYDDVHPSMHPFAELSLEAHLIKLAEEKKIYFDDARWHLRSEN